MNTAKSIYVKSIEEKPLLSEDPNTTDEYVTAVEPLVKKLMSEESKALLTETTKIPSTSQSSDALPKIKRQFCSFDATSKLPPALLNSSCLKMNSVEAERAFSSPNCAAA